MTRKYWSGVPIDNVSDDPIVEAWKDEFEDALIDYRLTQKTIKPCSLLRYFKEKQAPQYGGEC
jgi:hypothetical protein